MVDVGDDAEISYLILVHVNKYSSLQYSVISLNFFTFGVNIVIPNCQLSDRNFPGTEKYIVTFSNA
jgi:hypothetical protein